MGRLRDLDGLKAMVKQNFEKDGFLLPTIMLNTKKEGVQVIGFQEFGEDNHKDALEEMLLKVIINDNLEEFVMVCEAWKAEGDDAMERMRQGMRVREMPDKVEIASITYSSAKEEVSLMANVTRRDNAVMVGEWEEHIMDAKETHVMQSRFQFLWQRAAVRGQSN